MPNICLSDKDANAKAKLMEEGFGDWTRKDYRAYLQVRSFHRQMAGLKMANSSGALVA